MPTGKVVGGTLLNEAAACVKVKITDALKGKFAGLSTDGWKCKRKNAVNAICANVDFKSYLIELIDVTKLNKDGASLCEQFVGMIDRVELLHGCIIIYFTTDADGGSNKGRKLLAKLRPWLILPSCWAHQFQLILGDDFKVNNMAAVIAEDATALIAWINNHGKVRKIFDKSQEVISKDRNAGRIIILAYLVANLTRWTTHFVAFTRLFFLRDALQLAVLQSRSAIIAAEVGAATSTEGERLKADAERFCALIGDTTFWNGLETVLGDTEPICLGTNINQKDSTRLDQVLLTIAGIFLRFADHPEPEVKELMLVCLEKRWKDCDQPVFLAALILNPFEKLSCFGPNTNLNQFKSLNLLIALYRRMKGRPDNLDTLEQRRVKEAQVSEAFIQYLSGTGDFADFNTASWEQTLDNVNPIQVWEAFSGSSRLLPYRAILHIVANQAGCERAFSRTKIEQSDHRNRLGLEKIDKRTKVKADILSDHEKQGIYKERKGRKNHKSIASLLSVPRYRDLLEDQDDKDPSERGRALVSSAKDWRSQTAKWVADAQAAEREELDESDSEDDADDGLAPPLPNRLPAWKSMTLQVSFGGAQKPRARKPSARVLEEEERLMQELADELEDRVPDDGAIEIDSDHEFHA
ncbi:ribonuclease H-like domain-containing protein [Mycena sp. CBHHK59/15]|nr:ribonuclease H-like domain-containing protein [Mycena sp. CBHHK59/15]KAJ6613244.1 ribonuclease H-like domain-containing protein [Mycena sp. CBHHK59/15]